jgi:Predicted phosphohydrolases
MKFRWTRRKFLAASLIGVPTALLGYARFVEPDWIKVRTIRLGNGVPKHRFVHFTDLHHKGDRDVTLSVVKIINSLSPDFVCFTGDLIEEEAYLSEALELLGGIKAPVYGVPGNHDYWSKAPMGVFAKGFEGMGGAWLMDEEREIAGGKINLIGASCRTHSQPPLKPREGAFNLLLMHYPAWANRLNGHRFDLLLAGHSHGGQVRIPFVGSIIVPFSVEGYDLGMFDTPAGKLYVNPGIGWFPVPLRFNCRPEITVFEI